MKFTTTLISLAMAAGAFAVPLDVEERAYYPGSEFQPTPIYGCLQEWQANKIVNAFNYLLANPQASNFNETAKALFAPNFVDTSDSINQLAGLPEGSATFPSRAAFITGSSSQPPLVLDTLGIFWSCNAISWRWISVSGTGNDNEKVKGIDVFELNPNGKIQNTFAEFNSGAWLADLGYPECANSTATTTSSTSTASATATSS